MIIVVKFTEAEVPKLFEILNDIGKNYELCYVSSRTPDLELVSQWARKYNDKKGVYIHINTSDYTYRYDPNSRARTQPSLEVKL